MALTNELGIDVAERGLVRLNRLPYKLPSGPRVRSLLGHRLRMRNLRYEHQSLLSVV